MSFFYLLHYCFKHCIIIMKEYREVTIIIKLDYTLTSAEERLELVNKILEEEHFECEICRETGKYKRAYLVHHVRFVRKYPYLALSKYYTYKGKRYKNLLALCNDCHEKIHDRNSFKNSTKEKFKNEERW